MNKKLKILVVDDEALIRWSLKEKLSHQGYDVLEAEDGESAFRIINYTKPDLAVVDVMMPNVSGIDLLQQIRDKRIALPIIMLTAVDETKVAVQALKLGAVDYLLKPINDSLLNSAINKALEHQVKKDRPPVSSDVPAGAGQKLIGESPAIQDVKRQLEKIAKSKSTTALITGATGTGKDVVANLIHDLSPRRKKPFVIVNCTALTETLFGSELFGHEKGAFTDAKLEKRGLIEQADGGSIFFDEIGEIPSSIQKKLLRLIETKTYTRVGSTKEKKVDVRIISATNRDLEANIAEGSFRADLFYRINVINLHLPRLNQRGEDIIILAKHFLNHFNQEFDGKFIDIAPETRAMLLSYQWPGNVRELKNVIERAVVLNEDTILHTWHLNISNTGAHNTKLDTDQESGSLADIEVQALVDALDKVNWNQTKAARELGVSRDTLRYRMKKYNLKK